MGSIISKKSKQNKVKNKQLIVAEIFHNNETIHKEKQLNDSIKLCCKNIENHSKIDQYQDDFTKLCCKKIEDYSNACINSELIIDKKIYSKLELEYVNILYKYKKFA